MAKKFRDLHARMSPEAQARAAARASEIVAEATLAEIRTSKEVTQARLAEILEVSQGAISKVEARSDAYISTVRDYVEAMGGELELIARFPEGVVRITSFKQAAGQPSVMETAPAAGFTVRLPSSQGPNAWPTFSGLVGTLTLEDRQAASWGTHSIDYAMFCETSDKRRRPNKKLFYFKTCPNLAPTTEEPQTLVFDAMIGLVSGDKDGPPPEIVSGS
jgi:hypothetical protein